MSDRTMSKEELEAYILEKMCEIETMTHKYLKDNDIDINDARFKFIDVTIDLTDGYKEAHLLFNPDGFYPEERYLFEVYVGGRENEE